MTSGTPFHSRPVARLLGIVSFALALLTSPAAHAQTPAASTPQPAPLPASIPILPLPTGVLFPNVSLPIHIFEPRYRALIEDALAGDRIVGIVLQRSAFEGDTDEQPAVYAIGTAGMITGVESLPDGRFNVVVRGLVKFRLGEDDQTLPYRRARVEALAETLDAGDAAMLASHRARLEELATLATGLPPARLGLSETMSDADLVHTLAFHLDFDPLDSQGLLEREGILARAEALIELLETNTALPR